MLSSLFINILKLMIFIIVFRLGYRLGIEDKEIGCYNHININSNSNSNLPIKVINNNGKGVCLVVDNNHNLKGLLTDGDIRRLLLKGSRLFDKIFKKYNKKFFYIKKKDIYKVNLSEIRKKFPDQFFQFLKKHNWYE